MKKLFLLLLAAGLLSASAMCVYGQTGPVAEFIETDHNFGDVPEEGGPVVHTFEFVNKGDAPLIISGVRASCGCTTPGWSKEPVPPGERGFVKAQYNPANRPGSFHKSLTITSNSSANSTQLFIKGNVTPKPRTPADDYPTKLGNLRFKSRSMNFGLLTTEKPVTKEFEVYNDGNEPISFLDKSETPGHIKVSFDPAKLEPKAAGKIIVTYISSNERLGYSTDNLKLFTNEAAEAEKQLYVLATIEEYFSPMTSAEKAKAPNLAFGETSFDFGRIAQASAVTHDFTFTNTGKTLLNIRDTKTNCNCAVSNVAKKDIKPGETGTLSVTFDPKGRKGTQQKTVTIFSNDPLASTQTLTVKAYVE